MIITGDVETTTWSNGSVYDKRNFLVANAYQINEDIPVCTHATNCSSFQHILCNSILLVGFNLKFDIGWWRTLGINSFPPIHDCQLAEFYLSGQTKPYPSLDDCLIKYNLPTKLDIVKTNYWDKDINTDAIPWPVLSEYAKHDVSSTYLVYLKQKEEFKTKPQLYKAFQIACQDLMVLQEMEHNGLKYNRTLCDEKAQEINLEISKIKAQLASHYSSIPINFGSGDQLSAFLYGGTIKEAGKEHVGFYKTGERKGQPKFKNIEILHTLPRLIQPLRNSELSKEGVFSTDVNTLKKLKGPWAQKFVDPLLRLSELEKLNSTYYVGLPEMAEKHNWEDGYIHGQFNQCVTRTSRLSSSKPNQQNFSGQMLNVFESRYDN